MTTLEQARDFLSDQEDSVRYEMDMIWRRNQPRDGGWDDEVEEKRFHALSELRHTLTEALEDVENDIHKARRERRQRQSW